MNSLHQLDNVTWVERADCVLHVVVMFCDGNQHLVNHSCDLYVIRLLATQHGNLRCLNFKQY